MIIINPGIIANFIILLIIILIITDWFTPLVKDYGKKIVIIYLLASFIFFYTAIPINEKWNINVGGYIFPALIYFFILFKKVKQDIVYVSTATILLGSSYFLFKELVRLDPILLFWDELYEFTLFILIITLVTASKLTHRIALLMGGLLLGELLFNLRHHNNFLVITLGDAKFRDLLWFSFSQLVILNYLLKWANNIYKKVRITNFAKIGDKN